MLGVADGLHRGNAVGRGPQGPAVKAGRKGRRVLQVGEDVRPDGRELPGVGVGDVEDLGGSLEAGLEVAGAVALGQSCNPFQGGMGIFTKGKEGKWLHGLMWLQSLSGWDGDFHGRAARLGG